VLLRVSTRKGSAYRMSYVPCGEQNLVKLDVVQRVGGAQNGDRKSGVR